MTALTGVVVGAASSRRVRLVASAALAAPVTGGSAHR
jgi:hypothetical protein